MFLLIRITFRFIPKSACGRGLNLENKNLLLTGNIPFVVKASSQVAICRLLI